MHFLDVNVIENLREAINSTNLFSHDESYKYKNYNLICAAMDRIDTCVKYLNSHAEIPTTEEDLIVFLVFACMLIDTVKATLKQFDVTYKYAEDKQNYECYKFFSSVNIIEQLEIASKDSPSDDKLFEYLRTLGFAHPVETNRPKFLKECEVQYSPSVLRYNSMIEPDCPETIGLVIYSSTSCGMFFLTLPFSLIKNYIQSRYILINDATKKAIEIVEKQEQKWKEHKVNRSLSPVETLQDIQGILVERHEEDMVEDIISYLTCELSNKNNSQSVDKFREALLNIIPQLCDAIDNMEYEKAHTIIEISYIRPKHTQEMCHYQMEKIFSYEIDYRTTEQAVDFSQGFAEKWVEIDVDNMQIEEIRLLVRTACYLEWLEQEEKK